VPPERGRVHRVGDRGRDTGIEDRADRALIELAGSMIRPHAWVIQ
jgi:hypothetical protein